MQMMQGTDLGGCVTGSLPLTCHLWRPLTLRSFWFITQKVETQKAHYTTVGWRSVRHCFPWRLVRMLTSRLRQTRDPGALGTNTSAKQHATHACQRPIGCHADPSQHPSTMAPSALDDEDATTDNDTTPGGGGGRFKGSIWPGGKRDEGGSGDPATWHLSLQMRHCRQGRGGSAAAVLRQVMACQQRWWPCQSQHPGWWQARQWLR